MATATTQRHNGCRHQCRFRVTEEEEDVPRLSEYTLEALREFLAENAVRDPTNLDENWQLSQFWYSDETATALANQVIRLCGQNDRIVCISCPTLYRKLKELECPLETKLLEYDKRFAVFGDDFVFYDYNHPTYIPVGLTSEVVVADPPFLSTECIEKVSETIKIIAPKYIILCTGAVMESDVQKFLGLKMAKFSPTHTRNLGNEFKCFTNY
ncbi:EEF1A lysine methyltransferase 1-like [Ornithodoros turicata]|uniref:EEF1A lysine methyltransferase 1-like n=1 Tax=Ornithodoros turicata TaxID=34597 RepID=UPI0031399ADB